MERHIVVRPSRILLCSNRSSLPNNTKSITTMRIILLLLALLALSNAFVTQQPSFTRNSAALDMTILSYKGKKKNFPAGSPLSKACAALGVKVKYSCKKGDCATCQVSVAGRMTRACIGKVPPEPTLKSLKEKGLEIKN